MYLLLDCEIKYMKTRYLLGAYASVVFGIDAFFLINFGYTSFMKFYPLLVHLPVFIVFVFLSRFNAIKVFFIHWTLVAISTSFSLLGLVVSYFFDSSRVVVNLVSYILYIPTWLIMIKHIRPTFILAISAYYMIFRFFRQTREQLILQSEQNLLINQVAAAKLHFEALEESLEKTKLYRHDMRHHLNLINSYLADNNREAAQKYIAEV